MYRIITKGGEGREVTVRERGEGEREIILVNGNYSSEVRQLPRKMSDGRAALERARVTLMDDPLRSDRLLPVQALIWLVSLSSGA